MNAHVFTPSPASGPALVTVRVKVTSSPSETGFGLAVIVVPRSEPSDWKLAETVFAASMVTRQVEIPVHAPPQPRKPCPASGVAVRLTNMPWLKEALQVAPQLMPAGED